MGNNINRLINETFHAEYKHQVDKKNSFAKTSKVLCGLLSQYHKSIYQYGRSVSLGRIMYW